MDRVTCISTPMYTGKWKDKYEMSLECMIETPHCILIYCRPPIERILDFTGHVAKSYDDEQKIRWLIDNARNIVRRYDQFFEENVPHMVWDYTNPDPNVIEMAKAAQFTRGDWQRCQTLMG